MQFGYILEITIKIISQNYFNLLEYILSINILGERSERLS